MTITTWLSLVAVCALGAASPGPSLLVVARHSMTGSRIQGAVCALAHAAGVGLYALLTVLGLAVIVAKHPQLYRLVASAGACYLAWLGIRALRESGNRARESEARADIEWRAALRDGFTIALLNPKIALFFLALFSQFVGPDPGLFETLLLSTTAMGVDAAWYLVVALVLSGSPALTGLRQRAGFLSVLTGSALIVLAGWTLTRLWLP